MLGQDEHETDKKNRTSTNSAYEFPNPLEMVKNQLRLLNRLILMSEQGVRPKLRFLAQMSTKQTQKNLAARNSSSELTNPLEIIKKTCQALESLNYDV